MPAELPLVPSAVALAFSGLFFLLRRRGTWSHLLGTLLVLTGAAIPLALHRYVDPARSGGRALWEWSAVGGPAIEASYKIDAIRPCPGSSSQRVLWGSRPSWPRISSPRSSSSRCCRRSRSLRCSLSL